MKKVIALILALLMCACSLVACSSDDDKKSNNGTVDTGVEGDDGKLYDSNGYLMDEVGTKDFGQREIHILGWSNVAVHLPEYDVEDITGEKVNDAAYKRNQSTEERLGVKLEYETLDGWSGGGGGQEQIDRVRNTVGAGSKDYDLISVYSTNACTFMLNGWLADLSAMPNLDLSAPWWNETIMEKCSIYGHTYFATGDIAPSVIRATYAVFFNKAMAEEYHKGDIYALYDEGKWTLETLMQLCADVGSDEDGWGTQNLGDKFGFAALQVSCDALFHGSGLITVESAPDGSLSVSDNFGSEKTQTLLERLVTFKNTDDTLFDGDSKDLTNDSWVAGNTLFFLSEYAQVPVWVQNGGPGFGVLPMPKYDESQQEYYTTVGFYHSQWAVPRVLQGDECVGAVLEVLASESYRKVTPAYFENLFQLRYADGSRESEMFASIKDSVVFDPGRAFSPAFGALTSMTFRNCLYASDTGWMSAYKGMESTLESGAKKINDFMATFENENESE
ncbi:MAG: hypothetical protein IJY08_03910 [Clostridia bacterium]|nr:hypothetical protein [Clostridia bacterium]